MGSHLHAQEVGQRTKEAEARLNALRGRLLDTGRDMASEAEWLRERAFGSFAWNSGGGRQLQSCAELVEGGIDPSIL